MAFYLKQSNDHDCGPATLKMLLAAVHKQEEYLYINFDKPDASFSDLIEEASKYDVTLVGYEVAPDTDELFSIKKPVIVELVFDDLHHFVFIEKINRHLIEVFDSDSGRYLITRKQLRTYLTGKVLIVEEVKPKKLDKIRFPQDNKHSLVFSIVLQLITAGALMLGLYFIQTNSYFAYPIVFLSFFVIFYLTERYWLLERMKKFDQQQLISLLENVKNPKISDFNHLQIYKAHIFSTPLIVVTSLFVCLAIIVITAINHQYHLLGLAIVSCLVLVKSSVILFKGKYLLQLKAEQQALGKILKEGEPMRTAVNAMNETTNKLVIIDIIINLTIQVIIAIIVFLMMIIAGLAALNYALFYYFAYLYYANTLQRLITIVSSKLSSHQEKANFIYTTNK